MRAMPDPNRRILERAKLEAHALGHAAISTEHVLLAIAADSTSAAHALLVGLGAAPDAIRAAVLALAPSGDFGSASRLPFTPDAKRMLEATLNAATALAAARIDDMHLLLGLVSNPDFTAARALARLGLGPEAVRKAVLRA